MLKYCLKTTVNYWHADLKKRNENRSRKWLYPDSKFAVLVKEDDNI
jgi:hypothetical protein